jgi:D-sedoheptulose 7-phosphate isomerase
MFKYFDELAKIFSQIEVTDSNGKSTEVAAGMEMLMKFIKDVSTTSKKIIFIGNGGSASIASHQAIDYWKNGNIKAICFNDGAQLTCLGNDFGYEFIFEKPVQCFAEKGDLLIAISSSGKSKNILKGVDAGKDKGCKIVTMSGFGNDNPLRQKGDLNFYAPSSSYGFVEIIHLAICHAALDNITCK